LRRDMDTVKTYDWAASAIDIAEPVVPWRTFRWVYGQRHYSGSYWSATTVGHVIYESRLELARVIYADFDQTVNHIVAQPFQLQARVRDKVRRHVPDYLLLTESGPVVVDVKPAHRLSSELVALTFAWTRRLVEGRGWRYEIWSEPSPVEYANVKFLAGFRDKRRFNEDVVDALSVGGMSCQTFGQVCANETRWAPAIVRAHLLHVLWSGRFVTELSVPLSTKSLLKRRIGNV
jgi:hypothetical protein